VADGKACNLNIKIEKKEKKKKELVSIQGSKKTWEHGTKSSDYKEERGEEDGPPSAPTQTELR